MLRRARRSYLALAAALCLALLAACGGSPNPASNVTSTSTDLTGSVTCDTGQTCLVWVQYRQQGQTAWADTQSQAAPADSQAHAYAYTLTGLQPATTYEWQGCAEFDQGGGSSVACVGSDGQASTIETFTTLGPSAQPSYAENFQDPVAPLFNSTGGTATLPQTAGCPYVTQQFSLVCFQANTAGPGNVGKSRGAWLTQAGGYFGAPNSVDLRLPAYATQSCPSTTGTCALTAAGGGEPRWTTNQVGTTTYHSMAVYIPASGWAPGNTGADGPNYLEIEELHFAYNPGTAALKFSVFPNHISVDVATGLSNNSSTVQYWSDPDHWPNHPTGAIELPQLYAIPPGALVNGAWNEMIVGVHWATDQTGTVQLWHRVPGGLWQSSGPACTPTSTGPCGSLTGVPTTQFLAGGQPPNTWDDGPEAYGEAVPSAFDVILAGFATGPTFDSVAAQVP